MTKQLQITIPTPCHEDWEKMNPIAKGKFCNSCKKQVVDFSSMSDRQLAEFFKKPSNGSVCGRFMTDQLERDIEIPRKRIPWIKYFFQIVLPAFLVTIKASANKTQGFVELKTLRQTEKFSRAADTIVMPEVTIHTGIKPVEQPKSVDFSSALAGRVGCPLVTVVKKQPVLGEGRDLSKPSWTRQVAGTVSDENGNPLPGISVVIKGTTKGVVADNNGQFRIDARIGNTIVFCGVGCYTTEILVSNFDKLTITLKRFYLGVVSVKKIKKESIPLLTPIHNDSALKDFKIFPNPIKPGANLTIEWKQKEGGNFTLQMINQAGQTVHQQETTLDRKARFIKLEVPELASGAYFLVLVFKKTGKKYTEKIIIE